MTVHLPANLKTPRVYFKAEPSGPEYYVDMHHGMGDVWWAMLPPVDASTKAVTYRAAGLDANNKWSSGSPVTVATTTACAKDQMTSSDLEAANNIVLGLTAANESPVPVGFMCRGIKEVIDVNGQMRPAEDCRRALVAAGAPGTGAPTAVTAAQVHAATIAAAAVGVAALGYAVSHNNKNNNAVSNSRP